MNIIKNFYNMIINNEKLRHIKRFGIVGCLNTAVDFGLFSLLNNVNIFGFNYVISQIISYSVGTLNSYLLNKFWTFKDTRINKKTTKEIIQFITVNSASLAASILGLRIFISDNSMNSMIAKILSMGLAQVVNFLGYRFWVFGKLVKPLKIAKKQHEITRALNLKIME